MPLTYYGAYKGFTKIIVTKQVSPIRRKIPDQPFWLKDSLQILVGAFVIFTTVVAEFSYFFQSVWRSYIYGAFGILTLNLSLLSIVIILVSVLSTYVSLQHGNWAWWWRSFGIGYFTGILVMFYCIGLMFFETASNLGVGDILYLLFTIWSDIV